MKTGSLQVPEHQHIKEDLQMENIVLNNKLECPVVGIGTFMLSPADAENSVREALKMGYRLVDTAREGEKANKRSPFLLCPQGGQAFS